MIVPRPLTDAGYGVSVHRQNNSESDSVSLLQSPPRHRRPAAVRSIRILMGAFIAAAIALLSQLSFSLLILASPPTFSFDVNQSVKTYFPPSFSYPLPLIHSFKAANRSSSSSISTQPISSSPLSNYNNHRHRLYLFGLIGAASATTQLPPSSSTSSTFDMTAIHNASSSSSPSFIPNILITPHHINDDADRFLAATNSVNDIREDARRSSFFAAATAADANDGFAGPDDTTTATSPLIIGIIRVPGLDTPERLTGFMVAMHQANEERMINNQRNFTAEVYYYPHCGAAVGLANGLCDFSDGNKATGLRDFLGNMSRFHGIMFPQFDISAPIIDRAVELGGIPILDPNTIRSSDYEQSNLFLIDHNIETELAVLVRFMLMSHSCARTGIVTEINQMHYAELVQNSFTHGGYHEPPILLIPTTDAETIDFFFDDPNQKCIVFLLSSMRFMTFMGVVKNDARFVPGDVRLFGWSQISTTNMRIDGTSLPFKNLFYPKALPALQETDTTLVQNYNAAAARWFAANMNTTDVQNHYQSGEVATTAASTSGLMWYFRAMYGLQVIAGGFQRQELERIRSGDNVSYAFNSSANELVSMSSAAASNYSSLLALNTTYSYNVSAVKLATWRASVEVALNSKFWVSDYSFFAPFNKCPQKPLPQVCFCNIVTRVLNIRSINPTSGAAIPISNRPLLGDVNIAAMPLSAEQCIHQISLSSYPFRVMTVMDVGVSRDSEDSKTVGKTAMERFLYGAMATQNSNSPIRPWRLVTETFPAGLAASDVSGANTAVHELTEQYKPFMIISTVRTVTKTDVLSMFTYANVFVEDPPLTSRADGWNEKVLHFMPVIADLIHALAGFYASSCADCTTIAASFAAVRYNALYVIVSNAVEAELVMKSLHTFQIDFKRENIVISSDVEEWKLHIQRWATSRASVTLKDGSSAAPLPFVLAAAGAVYGYASPFFTTTEEDSSSSAPSSVQSTSAELVSAVYNIVHDIGSIHVGLAAPEPIIGPASESRLKANASYRFPASGDVIYASPFSEHWMETNPISLYIHDTLGINIRNKSTERPYAMNYVAMAVGLALTLGSQGIELGKNAADLLYTARTASVADVPLGLFFNDTCDAATIAKNAVGRTCQCNKAFRQFRLHSVYNRFQTQLSSRTGHYVYSMDTCGVNYQPLIIPPSDGTAQMIAIIASVASVVVLGILFGAVIFVCTKGRNNSKAPKDNSKPFTMAFTDIQASTTLWSRCPEVMSDAVEHHNAIIRKLIGRYNGYEVKTIGDSFMVAFREVEEATLFSIRLQQAFHEDNQWPAELDQHYKEILETALIEFLQQQALANYDVFDEDGGDENGNTVNNNFCASKNVAGIYNHHGNHHHHHAGAEDLTSPLNAPADEAEYNRLWHGLRVRVGVHFGFGEIRKDEITQGYDYFGTIVNTAARVEGVGHGGQTLVTSAVIAELTPEFINTTADAVQMSMGPQNLRGLDDKIGLIQLLPRNLADRKFPNLRLDVENVIDDGSESGTGNNSNTENNLTTEQLAAKLVNDVVNRGKKKGTGSSTNGSSMNTIGPAAAASFITHSPLPGVNGVNNNNLTGSSSNNNNAMMSNMNTTSPNAYLLEKHTSSLYPSHNLTAASTTNDGGIVVIGGNNSFAAGSPNTHNVSGFNSNAHIPVTHIAGIGSMSGGGGGGDATSSASIINNNVSVTASAEQQVNNNTNNNTVEKIAAQHPLQFDEFIVRRNTATGEEGPATVVAPITAVNGGSHNYVVAGNQQNLAASIISGQANTSNVQIQQQRQSSNVNNTAAPGATPSITNNGSNNDTASVNELMSYFNFFNALLSTCAENFKKDTVKQMAKRWHVPFSGGFVGTNATDPTRVRIMMNLAVKGMMMVRAQQAKAKREEALKKKGSNAGRKKSNTGSRVGDLVNGSNTNAFEDASQTASTVGNRTINHHIIAGAATGGDARGTVPSAFAANNNNNNSKSLRSASNVIVMSASNIDTTSIITGTNYQQQQQLQSSNNVMMHYNNNSHPNAVPATNIIPINAAGIGGSSSSAIQIRTLSLSVNNNNALPSQTPNNRHSYQQHLPLTGMPSGEGPLNSPNVSQGNNTNNNNINTIVVNSRSQSPSSGIE